MFSINNFASFENNKETNDVLIIPKSSLGYGTNNQYPEIPPFMSDGRSAFASWQPEAIINKEIIKDNNLQTNWEYRQFMMKNGLQIMQYNNKEACNDVGYYRRYVPEIKENKPINIENQSTDLKQMYFSREQLQSQRISKEITPEQLQSSLLNA